MRADSFDYFLPPSFIAKEPISPRDACKLMLVDREADFSGKPSISDHRFFDLEKILQKGDVLIFNDSKVLPARISFLYSQGERLVPPTEAPLRAVVNKKNFRQRDLLPAGNPRDPSDASLSVGSSPFYSQSFLYARKQAEIFLLRQIDEHNWTALVKPGKFFQKGEKILLSENLQAEVVDVFSDGTRRVHFSLVGNFDEKKSQHGLDLALEKVGSVPLPPYIKNSKATFDDYQTVYAKEKGSVAAPTAGLHFTPRLLKKLETKGVQLEFVTLHVGAGTFLPIKSQRIEDHFMHSEFFELKRGTADRLNKAHHEGRRLIAVGTTSVRVLESSFHSSHGFEPGIAETDIYIYPGYRWKCVNGLITNFHLPKSTLLLLVSAFAGKELILKAYDEAIRRRYRFYSFGDAMFIA